MPLYLTFLLLLLCEAAQASQKPKFPRDNYHLLF